MADKQESTIPIDIDAMLKSLSLSRKERREAKRDILKQEKKVRKQLNG